MGPGKNIICAGDFNFYSGNESDFQTLIVAGNGQAVDPTHAPAVWENAANRIVLTQSPATVSAYGGQVLGGMDDRFDFELSSNALNYGQGLSIIPGSYRAFGNNGTQPFNGAINDRANTWNPPGLTVPAKTVLDALTTASDHIPVVVDYQLPAKMSVGVGTRTLCPTRKCKDYCPADLSHRTMLSISRGSSGRLFWLDLLKELV